MISFRFFHQNMFETGVVRANECIMRHKKDIFSIFSSKYVRDRGSSS